jgi:hypothetical protein
MILTQPPLHIFTPGINVGRERVNVLEQANARRLFVIFFVAISCKTREDLIQVVTP